jgi:heat shock protein HslJ
MNKAALILFTLFMISCEGQPEPKKTEKDFLKQINGKWNLSEINGVSNIELNGLKKIPFIQFDGNKVFGTNGCNNFFSSITTITINKISFSPFGETKMMCQEMKIPDAFGILISNTDSYFIKGKTLVFLNKENKKVLTFTKE